MINYLNIQLSVLLSVHERCLRSIRGAMKSNGVGSRPSGAIIVICWWLGRWSCFDIGMWNLETAKAHCRVRTIAEI